jgi:hypothetical protein
MDPVEHTILIPATIDAALRRQALETGVSINRAVIEALSTGLAIAHKDNHPVPPGQVPTDDPPAGLEQEALEEGTWL